MVFACCASAILLATDSSRSADFTGNWVLDASQTKNLPQGLEEYRLTVAEDAQQLKVDSTLRGDLRAAEDAVGRYPGGGRRGSGGGGGIGGGGIGGGVGMGGTGIGGIGMGRSRGGMGAPMGEDMPGAGYPGGGQGPGQGTPGGRPRSAKQGQARVAAFQLYPPSALYRLDGSQSTAALGAPAHGDATLKADLAKNGDALKLAITETDQDSGQIQLKEQWKLSKDGQSLLIDRDVHSPGGSANVHLVFYRQGPGSTGSK